MTAVSVSDLSKIYSGSIKAVDSISFTLEKGTVFGFLGPNGAGKTTTVKLLNGILSPTDGTCSVFDIDPFIDPNRIHQLSGIVTEHAQMYDNMTGLDNLIFYGMLYGANSCDSRLRAHYLLDQFGIIDAKKQKLATYSTGMRQRLSLARSIMHYPKILFLDEPTSGLDPESVHDVNKMIKELADNDGVTIFLCTHQLRYAQEVCSSYGLINHGALLAAGTINELRSLTCEDMTVRIKCDRVPPDVSFTNVAESTYEMKVKTEKEIPYLVKSIVDHGGSIYHVSNRKLSLEEVYFSLLKNREKQGDVS